jgi:hypothetical protein
MPYLIFLFLLLVSTAGADVTREPQSAVFNVGCLSEATFPELVTHTHSGSIVVHLYEDVSTMIQAYNSSTINGIVLNLADAQLLSRKSYATFVAGIQPLVLVGPRRQTHRPAKWAGKAHHLPYILPALTNMTLFTYSGQSEASVRVIHESTLGESDLVLSEVSSPALLYDIVWISDYLDQPVLSQGRMPLVLLSELCYRTLVPTQQDELIQASKWLYSPRIYPLLLEGNPLLSTFAWDTRLMSIP